MRANVAGLSPALIELYGILTVYLGIHNGTDSRQEDEQVNCVPLSAAGAVFTMGQCKSHGTSYQTARTDLLRLSDELKILTRRKRGNAFVFVAPQSLKKALEPFRV